MLRPREVTESKAALNVTTDLRSFADAKVRRSLAIAAVALAATIVSSPARTSAQLNVCNRTSQTISVAVAALVDGEWTTRGWYNASPGSCVTPINGPLLDRYYYVHGRNVTGTWGRGASFCVLTGYAFNYRGRTNCGADGYSSADFFMVDTNYSASYRFDLTAAPNDGEHQAIDGMRVIWRISLGIEKTYVLHLRNDLSYAVSFNIKCYTKDGGWSKWFSVTVSGKSYSEIGFLEGWPGNFVSGEYCDAYHGQEYVWRTTAPVGRRAY